MRDVVGQADRSISVIVADDEEAFRRALGDLIEHEPGFALVGTAMDADSAIALAVRLAPDVALIDLRMPGGGARATADIRRRSPKTHVVAISAYDDRASVLEMFEAGASSYVIKGGSVGELLRSVEAAVVGESSLSPSVAADVVAELSAKLSREHAERRERELAVGRVRGALRAGAPNMVFQPIKDLNDGSTIAVEALARFAIEPPRAPNVWFAEAAAVGLGTELELAAIANTLHALPSLPQGIAVAINASPQTVLTEAFRSVITQVPLDRIILEITEHAIVDDYGRLVEAIRELRAAGLRLSIDDAGAGYASLRHILRLEPAFIKADIDLIRDIDTDRAKRALVAALVAFGSDVDASIIAEGIETPAEEVVLQALGVTYGQGYHLGRPTPV